MDWSEPKTVVDWTVIGALCLALAVSLLSVIVAIVGLASRNGVWFAYGLVVSVAALLVVFVIMFLYGARKRLKRLLTGE